MAKQQFVAGDLVFAKRPFMNVRLIGTEEPILVMENAGVIRGSGPNVWYLCLFKEGRLGHVEDRFLIAGRKQ